MGCKETYVVQVVSMEAGNLLPLTLVMRPLRASLGLVVTIAFADLARGTTVAITETFDSSSSAASQGWVGLGNTNDGNNYGFSATSFAGGPAGESGGFFNHATN